MTCRNPGCGAEAKIIVHGVFRCVSCARYLVQSALDDGYDFTATITATEGGTQ